MDYKIPLFDLNFDETEEQAVIETMRSRWISTGPKCEEFETKFATALNIKYGITVTNCTAALHLALLASGINKNDEVLVPSLTFVATVNSILYAGAKPVFVDSTSHSNPNISPLDLASKISKRTKAIIVMHYAGFPCEMETILAIAKKNNLIIIEDACHGPLSEYNGRKLGTLGDLGCFSFFSNKNISTGEGGMIVTNSDKYNNIIKIIRSHGMTSLSYQRAKGHVSDYDVIQLGYNYRMDDIRAAIGIVQLKKLPGEIKKRAAIREKYLHLLEDVDEVYIPFKKWVDLSSNYIFPIVLSERIVNKRDMVREYLHSCGIQTSIHYPAVHNFLIYKNYDIALTNAEYYANAEITLPMYGSLKEEDLNYIINSLKKAILYA